MCCCRLGVLLVFLIPTESDSFGESGTVATATRTVNVMNQTKVTETVTKEVAPEPAPAPEAPPAPAKATFKDGMHRVLVNTFNREPTEIKVVLGPNAIGSAYPGSVVGLMKSLPTN